MNNHYNILNHDVDNSLRELQDLLLTFDSQGYIDCESTLDLLASTTDLVKRISTID